VAYLIGVCSSQTRLDLSEPYKRRRKQRRGEKIRGGKEKRNKKRRKGP
jgi:hypothetical protein